MKTAEAERQLQLRSQPCRLSLPGDSALEERELTSRCRQGTGTARWAGGLTA